MYQRLERLAVLLARLMALAGGVALILVVVISCVSIAGRAGQHLGLPLWPIPGDTEWVEFGMGFAVFAFLPWCTLMRGHAAVDLFQPVFGPVLNRVIDLVSDLSMLAVAGLIAWRTWLGMLDKKSFHETTYILRAEIWQGYAAAMLGAAAFVLVAAFCVLRSARALRGGAT